MHDPTRTISVIALQEQYSGQRTETAGLLLRFNLRKVLIAQILYPICTLPSKRKKLTQISDLLIF